MSEREKLKRLEEIARLTMDTRLMALEKAARARQQSLDLLAELDRPSAAADLPPLVAAEVEMRYSLWADQRRREINQLIARQTAAWIEARDEAARAFGRHQVIGKLRR